jgi:hypothetical protein
MKVIHMGGEPKKKRRLQSTCRECGTVVEATADSLKWEHYPRNESLAREKCPNIACGAEIFFYP